VNGLFDVPEMMFAFVLMLGVLITVHEFGHFIVAKLCGVRVLKFSIGFGSPIGFGRFRLRWTHAGTEYVIAWFPLGGFVRMLGDTTEEMLGDRTEEPDYTLDPALAEQTLGSKSVWRKLAIVLAGPAMNLVLPVLILGATLMVGIDRAAPVVGTVERGSPAAAAGVRAGDRIVAVDGSPVAWWDEVEETIRARPEEQLVLDLERGSSPRAERLQVSLAAKTRPSLDIFRDQSDVGWLGLRHPRQKAVLGVPEADSPASRAGLRSGDRVEAVGGREVADWAGFAREYEAAAAGASVSLLVARGDAESPERLEVAVPAEGSVAALGVIPAVVLVRSVTPDSAASDAGLAPGDLIVAVDGAPIGSFFTFQETVFTSKGRALRILVARDGASREFEVAPRLTTADLGGGEEEIYLIGISGENAILVGSLGTDRELNPLVAFPRAFKMTVDLTGLFLRGLKKLVVGDISRKNIGGPIEIAKQSHRALQRGWDDFLRLLILISINLGILNLLPIPILDGGQALIYIVEGVKRSPLSMRTREFVQQVGLVFLVSLMGLAFWNDISRHWSSFVDWVRGLV